MAFELPPKKKEVYVDLSAIMEEADLEIMQHIGSTEPSTFFELCNALRTHGLCPEKGDKAAWSNLFKTLNKFVAEGYATCKKTNNQIQSIQLTKEGADKIRAYADKNRPLIVDDNDDCDTLWYE